MRIVFVAIFFLTVISESVFSQTAKNEASRTCLEVAKELSYYWQLDSLGNNGMRLYTYKMLLDSKPNKIFSDILITYLGKPNQTEITNKGTTYIYYYFDYKAMPKGFDAPYAANYIGFRFEAPDNFLKEIVKGSIDW